MLYLIFVLVCWFSVGASADEGDDFSNNLFSDLAPLLALFGERVTMQFMSHSMGWADHIILAMGPLGILTVVVSAIRVGGPTWLKALVGRAMENLAAAELDILSSTSQEVCELWNGEQVVRCMGPSPVTEFIILKPDKKLGTSPKVVVEDWDVALKEHLEDTTPSPSGEILSSLKEVISRISSSQIRHRIFRSKDYPDDGRAEAGFANNPPISLENIATSSSSKARDNGEPNAPSSPVEGSTPEIIVIRNTSKHVPNISLNCHKGSRKWELWLFAAIGCILQLGAVAYCGFATYYPTMRLPKDGKEVATYAYPCTAIGTIVLVLGVMICSHVVESKTIEKIYTPRDGLKATMVWLQQGKRVNDQSFDSYAVFFAKGESPIITSERPTSERPTTEPKRFGHDITYLELETIGCTMVTICGFVIQFVVLRGMHWSASVTQLGIVLIMVAVKAWVRRGLASPPKCKKVLSGFELEWLSRALRDPGAFDCLADKSDQPETLNMEDWTIDTFELSQLLRTGDTTESDDTGSVSESDDTGSVSKSDRTKLISKLKATEGKAHELMWNRLNLGKLASYCDGPPNQPTWSGPSSGEGIAVARSIEIVMDALFSKKKGKYTWSIKSSKGQSVKFRVERRQLDQKWKVYSDEIEAALSLWLFAVELDPYPKATEPNGPALVGNTEDDSWLGAKRLSTKPSLSILGRYSQALHRDIWWWMPTKEGKLLVLENSSSNTPGSNSGEIGLGTYEAIVGRGFDGADAVKSKAAQFTGRELEEPEFDANSEPSDGSNPSFLAAAKNIPLRVVAAQDMFSAFMWGATANTQANPHFGKAILRSDANGGVNNWKSFVVPNDGVSKMALEIQQTGLGSLEQVYQCLLPPLSVNKRLPEPDAIIDLARREARVYEQKALWGEARDIYMWLFRKTRTFDEDSFIYLKATAVMVQFWRQVVFAIDDVEDGESQDSQLGDITTSLEHELTGLKVFPKLKALYHFQNRGWKDKPENEAKGEYFPPQFHVNYWHKEAKNHTLWGFYEKPTSESPDVLGWTYLHYAASSQEGSTDQGIARTINLLIDNHDINARDLREWTPLHYACRVGQVSMVQLMISKGADVDAQGRDNFSPLHCAAFSGHQHTVRALIQAGAKVDIQDVFGNSPLLWAARKGHGDIYGYLSPIANRQLRNFRGRTVLHQAAISASPETVRRLLDDGKEFELEAKDREGLTPLHLAATTGQEAVVKLLLEKGAEIEAKDHIDRTSLHCAAERGKEMAIELLLEKGTEIEAKDHEGQTPLHRAAWRGKEMAIELLLDKGAQIEAKDYEGQTPLHCAVLGGKEMAIELLLNKGAQIKAKDHKGRTLLHLAAQMGKEMAIELLLEKGTEIEAKDDDSQTPLHLAAWRGKEMAIELLLDKGAQIEAKDHEGQTPLHRAVLGGKEMAIELLLDKGAQIEAKDHKGRTPLHIAEEIEREGAIKLLLEKGARPIAPVAEIQRRLRIVRQIY